MKTSFRSSQSRAPGVALIEVLVGVLLISFGLLGLISLLGRSVQMSVGSEDSLRAALLANEMSTLILSEHPPTAASITVSAAGLADWQARVADQADKGLPNGVGTVTVSGRTARITVQWRAPRAATTDVNTYSTDLVIP